MEFLSGLWTYVIPFLVVLTVLVFVHELGHYLVARRNGVRIEVFSIGFGPELFGWHDRAGTRWKFSAIPLGGYVKMFGDADAAEHASGAVRQHDAGRAEVSFHHKRLGQRAAIVAAGPVANFLFAIVGLALLFIDSTASRSRRPRSGRSSPDSAAEPGRHAAGRRDRRASTAQAIERFEDVQQIVPLQSGHADGHGRPARRPAAVR